MTNNFALDEQWKPIKVGAGGFITGIDVAPDGTMVARTDTYGAYIWTGTSWTQLVTSGSMPGGSFYAAGVYEIRVAASNSNVFYMTMADGIYKSIDKGQSWTKTSFPVANLDPNAENRMCGQKLAIDPANPNTVFAGTQKDGLWVTRDGGSTWQKITAVPSGTNTADPSMTGIAIKGSTIFVGTGGSGVYTSNDGGLSWKAIGGPADIATAVLSPDGSYYAAGRTDGTLWKYSNGSWTKLVSDPNNGIHSVAIDPLNPSHIVIATPGGTLQESHDAGASWSGWSWYSRLESSSDVPWLENTNKYMGSGGLVFDPLVPGKLWQAAGVGVWQTDLPSKMVWTDTVVWNSHSTGIEQLVANDIIAPAGGSVVLGSWDRAFFTMSDLDTYGTSYGGGDFSMGWSLDYASTDSSFLVGISDWWGKDNSGYSTDGGKTWQKFAGLPSWAMNTLGGSIAASTPTNFIWAAAGNQAPAYTLDGGKTWTNISIPGLTDWSVLQYSYYLARTTITADRVQPNTFYLYDANSGVYRTTDGGVTWAKVFSGQVSEFSYWNAKIEAVPGSKGELYFTSGPLGSGGTSTPDGVPFMHSTDGGASWKVVSGVQAFTFGYGAAASEGGPATVYVVGYVNGDYGIFYSTDQAQTWTKIGDRPMGSLDAIKTISGDMDEFGQVYIGFTGSGYAYLDFSSGEPTPPPAPVAVAPTQTITIAEATDNVGETTKATHGAFVNDSTPTLSGTLSAILSSDQKLVFFRDGKTIGSLAPTGTSWSFTDPGAPDGAHQYTARVENSSGLTGSFSNGFGLNVDTLAPNQIVTVIGVTNSTVSAPATSTLLTSTTTSTTTTTGLLWTKMYKNGDEADYAPSMDSGSGGSVTTETTATSTTSLMSYVSGTVSGPLGPDESLVVFRDGIKVGVGSVSGTGWSFTDSAGSGTSVYTARVLDAAGNLGPWSIPGSVSPVLNKVIGTDRADVLLGTSGADLISGVRETGTKLGKGVIDVLTGNGGADVFVLGDARGRFYDDGAPRNSGSSDYARITDFALGDKVKLKGTAAEYLQGWISNLNGFSGTGIYHDSNRNGVLDTKDELIALIQNHGTLDSGSFIFV